MLRLVPFLIDVHADDDWTGLGKRIQLEEKKSKGYGIPYGAGIVYHPDMTIEAVRFGCTEIVTTKNGEVKKSIILPSNNIHEEKKKA